MLPASSDADSRPALLTSYENLLELLAFSGGELAFVVFAVFAAGVIRGFSGFALSALVMASVSMIIPPASLIPVCWLLEGAASVILLRGGSRSADWRVVRGLAIGSALGVPFGLLATMHLPADLSRLIALMLIASLAAMQLAGSRPRILATRKGLYGSGVLAGLATGLASVGGMVVALYVLASNSPPARMRASLVIFLFFSLLTTGMWLSVTGMLNQQALVRGGLLAPIVIPGVLVGAWLFRPLLEGVYKRICLTVLIGLALAGILRLVFTA